MKLLLATLLVAVVLPGCAVYTPSGAVIVDPHPVVVAPQGRFCPPGQAKKGRC